MSAIWPFAGDKPQGAKGLSDEERAKMLERYSTILRPKK